MTTLHTNRTMDALISSLDRLLKHKNEDPSRFYTYLADYSLTPRDEKYFMESLIPKVYFLYEKNILRKDLVYLSLLSTQNRRLLEKFLDYDKSVFVLNIEDPVSLFDYYVYERRHWVYEIVNNLQSYEKLAPLKNVYGKLSMIQYIVETNRPQVDVDHLEKLSSNIDVASLDDFWAFYVKEIARFIDTVKFCRPLLKTDTHDTELFVFASANTLLETLSNFVDLTDPNHWNAILEKLESGQNAAELSVFTAFIVISMLVSLLIRENYNADNQKKDFVNSVFDNVKAWLLNLQDKQLQVELLQNIFHLLFYRSRNEFTCREKEIRFVLFLLKTVIEELQLKKTHAKDSEEYEKMALLSKHVTDFLWRLDLIVDTNMTPKVEEQLLNYMLATPESLIRVCLKRRNFERAHQVIQIFDLRDGDLAHEVNYSENFLKFKTFVRNNGKLKEAVADFFAKHPPRLDRRSEQAVDTLSKDFDYVAHYKVENETFMNIFDLALTETQTWEESLSVLTLAQERFSLDATITSNYLDFYKRITELALEVGPKDRVSLREILTSVRYPLDIQKYRRQEEFYETLDRLYDDFGRQTESHARGTFNKEHASYRTVIQMNEICNAYVTATSRNKDPVQYLHRMFNYLKAFSQILYIEQDSSEMVARGANSSYFDLLNFNRSELTGRLLFERRLDPTEFEKFFGRLKLDFLYHIAGNCFPTINLHVDEDVTIEELYHDNALYTPSAGIIEYIQRRNWLLAFILSEMYKVEGVKIDVSEVRLRTFSNYVRLARIRHLEALFQKNRITAALQNCISTLHVKIYLREQAREYEAAAALQSHHQGEGFDQAEEVFEDSQVSVYRRLYDVVRSIPEKQLKKKTDLDFLTDNVLIGIVQEGTEPEYYRYAYFITDRERRLDTILENLTKWPGGFASDLIKCEVSRFGEFPDSKLENLTDWVQHIELNDQLKDIFEVNTWHKSYSFCTNYPESALDKIMLTDQVDLLLAFINLYTPSEDVISNIGTNYLYKIMDLDIPLTTVKTLLDRLPFEHAIDVCHNLLTILRNLEQLQFIADYLNDNVKDDVFLKNVQVSLKMLTVFKHVEQEQFFCLINEPLSVLEVLLMNTKLDKLVQILEVLDIHNSNEYSEEIISVAKVDGLLRHFAEKSLDFRVITKPGPNFAKTPEVKFLQSLDSLSPPPDTDAFVVPEAVPTKEEWVKNDEVVECMCCRQVTFSMFNRRHHCRRCGRVVCYGCSLKRMSVASYGDILVRVCADCHGQTCTQKDDGSAGDKTELPAASFVQEHWLLNDDPEHNKIVREDFSYEHAPSTSLCLSILKYHSKTIEYPSFLLEQCEVMLRLLQPNAELTQELDYLLVIKMLKSLAVAAKIVSTESLLGTGPMMADRILQQADFLALLVERNCLNLMPLVGADTLYIDAHVLRRLRDRLLQREQWNLALEVSTKAGLDNTGVFAAWGKSCLKAGSLFIAREKFQRCFEKHSQYDTASLGRTSDLNRSLDSLTVGRSRVSSRISTGSNLSTVSENKPTKDPPLLHEIVQILETKTRTIAPDIWDDAQRANMSASMCSLVQVAPGSAYFNTAVSVVNRLRNLKHIASGNFSLSDGKKVNVYTTRPTLDPIFYEECVHYLGRYGTHLSLLEFYLRHGDIKTALLYIIENGLSAEFFIEIYMKCLKDGVVTILQEELSRIDSSLDVWKDHLRLLCRNLEKHRLLNCLYQLQLYIGDYVRASMTCILFYQENARTFKDLANNVAHLYKGEEHLKQILEQEQWVEVASVGKMSTDSKDSFEERMLSNPDLVMKIDTKDVNRHIHTVQRQVEVVNYLSECEAAGVNTRELLHQLGQLGDAAPASDPTKITIPTLFGSNNDKVTLAALAIVSGSVEDGFKLATKIIEDSKLRPIGAYCLAGKQFAKSGRYNEISQLVGCIKNIGINDAAITDMLDKMLEQAVGTLIKAGVTGTKVEGLIKLIKDRATKISAYIAARQLKTAYFLAVKYKRTADIRRIQSEAELLNMPAIKALCQKVLQGSPQSSISHSKES